MYEEFNGYLTKYKNEKIKEYNEKNFFSILRKKLSKHYHRFKMENIEKILKHNICFTSSEENVSTFISTRNFDISIVYKSNTIYDVKSLGIKNFKDLMDKIEPFLYYLAGKYQTKKENYCYEAFLNVDLAFPGEDFSTIYFPLINNYFIHECIEENNLLVLSDKLIAEYRNENKMISKHF